MKKMVASLVRSSQIYHLEALRKTQGEGQLCIGSPITPRVDRLSVAIRAHEINDISNQCKTLYPQSHLTLVRDRAIVKNIDMSCSMNANSTVESKLFNYHECRRRGNKCICRLYSDVTSIDVRL